jgi:hypothetical protein
VSGTGRRARTGKALDEARLLQEAKRRVLALAHKEAAAEARALARRRRARRLVALGVIAVVALALAAAALACTSSLAGGAPP